MAGLPKPPVPDGPIRALFDELHLLHHQAGWPSLREMAKDVGCSHTTISAAFSEPRVPRWGLLELIVETLDGDTAAFHRLWLAASVTGEEALPTRAATILTAPRSLPADVVGFVGRDVEVAALNRLLDDSAGAGSTAVVISALSGTAGIGKTALAAHWAHRVADRFPDGQLYLNLRGYDPDHPVQPAEALEALLRQLGVDGAAIPSLIADRAARLRTLLAGKRALLLLDNAHSVAQVRDLLPGSPGCFVLVTSRDALPALVARHGAVRLTIDLLSPDEAMNLLRRLIGQRVDAEPEHAQALAGRCARLPLAIRIAAELAVARPYLSLAELATELDLEPRRLDLLAAGDDEHTAIRTVFSWSLRHLTAADAHAFALLGEHPGDDIDLAAAAALFGTDFDATRRTTDALARAHLIEERDLGRYGMHDLLRAYAAELAAELPAADQSAGRARLFDHYLATARETASTAYGTSAHSSQGSARRWLDAERANLLAVAAAAIHESPEHTNGLAVVLSRYLDTGGHYQDALAIDGLALRVARDRGDSAAETAALGRLGVVHRRLGAYPEALDCLLRTLEIHRANGDSGSQAHALLGIGGIEWRLGRYAEAQTHLSEALAMHQEVGDRVGEARALHNLGIVYRRLGRYDEALKHYELALAAQGVLGDMAGQAGARNNLGIVQLRLGLYPVALANFGEALMSYRGLGDRAGEGAVLNNLGETFERMGRYDEAVQHHQRALEIHQTTGYRAGHAVALRGLGVAVGRLGRHGEALAYLERAITLGTEIGEADVKTRALIDAGEILHELGDTGAADNRYRAALDLAEGTDNTYEQARALDGLARLDQQLGRHNDAASHAATARRLFQRLGVAEATQ